MPFGLELIREAGDPGDVIRNRKLPATEPGENTHVPSSCEIRTSKTAPADFELNTKERVENLHFVFPFRNLQHAGTRSQRTNLLGIDRRDRLGRHFEIFLH